MLENGQQKKMKLFQGTRVLLLVKFVPKTA